MSYSGLHGIIWGKVDYSGVERVRVSSSGDYRGIGVYGLTVGYRGV